MELKSLPPPSKKLLHLQGIRGLAILAVVLFHFSSKNFAHGYLGVDIFFALSGYLMTMMLSKSPQFGSKEVLDFFYRRVKRIVPLYYLLTLFILGGLYFAPPGLRAANLDPAMNALLFITNLFEPDNRGGYFNKLGVAVDMFTHTWSLSLEMQFYVIFPLIFTIYKRCSEANGQTFIGGTSLLSFLFYCLTGEFAAFNSVFSRIWQFNAGMLIYTVTASDSQYDILPSEAELQPHCVVRRKSADLSTLYTLATLIGLMLTNQNMFSHISRVLAIVLTMQLFQYAGGSFLENKILVEIGEISYAWYLVHWPFAALCQLLSVTDPLYLTSIFLLTFSLSAILHYCFETCYLKWDKKTIIAFVLILIASNLITLFALKVSISPEESMQVKVAVDQKVIQISTPFNYPSDFLIWNPSYSTMTKDELIKLDEFYEATDYKRTFLEDFCKGSYVKTNSSEENRCRMEEGMKKDSAMHLLVIGNSYAGNLFPVIYDECKANFSRIEISFMGGCEVLARSETSKHFDCTNDFMYMDAVKENNPDVLFIAERHLQLLEIINGTNPFNDAVFQIASDRLIEIQKHVKQRIYLLDDFPETADAMDAVVDQLNGKTSTINDDILNAQTFANTIARMRIARLVNECPKCKSFDYTPQFFFNGKFKFYDPDHFVSFVTKGRHLTPVGWERIRPLIRHLCHYF